METIDPKYYSSAMEGKLAELAIIPLKSFTSKRMEPEAVEMDVKPMDEKLERTKHESAKWEWVKTDPILIN